MPNDFDVLDYFRQWPIMTGQQLFGVTGNNAASPGAAAWPAGGLLELAANGGLSANNGTPQSGALGLALAPDRISGDPAYQIPSPRQPVMVQPGISQPSLSTNPNYPSLNQLTSVLFNEDGPLGNISGVTPPGQSLSDLQRAQANVALNRVDRGVNWDKDGNRAPTGGLAPDVIAPRQMNGMFDQIRAGNPQAYNAWSLSFGAALDALNRIAPPSSGPGSALYYNQRPVYSTAGNQRLPDYPGNFNSTFGPYADPLNDPRNVSDGKTYWSFFGGNKAP